MGSGKRRKNGSRRLCRLRGRVMKLNTAHAGSEIVLPKMELGAAASRQETSHLQKTQVGTEARSAMEMFTTTPRTTVSSASQIITSMPELHDESLDRAKSDVIIQELQDEVWEKERCTKRIMDQMNSQSMEFRKVIQAKEKIISELTRKLDVQKHNGIDIGMENAATITNKSLTTTGRVGTSQFAFFRILGTGVFGTVVLSQKKGGADDGQFYTVLNKTSIIQNGAIDYIITERRILFLSPSITLSRLTQTYTLF
jgi:flagellin-specific chaperone FliS